MYSKNKLEAKGKMRMKSLAIINGKVFINNEFNEKTIIIENGKISQILEKTVTPPAVDEIIDALGKHITPGFIDLHVHLREPGFEHKETIATGTMAAAAGGFTQVFAMPNTNPVIDTPEMVAKFNEITKETAVIKTYTYGAITKNLRSEEFVDFEGMAKNGVCAFTNDGVGVQTAAVMYEAMIEASKLNLPITAHCEDDSLIYDGAFHQGDRAKSLNVPGIPNICESVQIARDVLLAEAANCHYHVCHVSTKESVRAIRDAKRAGIHVTAEVTPHHLLLTEDDIPDTDYADFKMNPPLRAKTDKAALIEGLLDGTIDCIATDHAPHHIDEKNQPIAKAPFGIIGSEHAFSLLYTNFVKTGKWQLEQLVNWLTLKPAKTYNLVGGVIEVGQPADLAIIDLEKEQIIKPPFISKAVNTPFINTKISGIPVMTICDGKIVFDQKKDVK